jgi:hypothetical protein
LIERGLPRAGRLPCLLNQPLICAEGNVLHNTTIAYTVYVSMESGGGRLVGA